jgi:hypothetical protein
MQKLPVEIAYLNGIKITDPDVPHACKSKIQRCRAPEAASAGDKNPRRFQSPLRLNAPLRKYGLSVISFQA